MTKQFLLSLIFLSVLSVGFAQDDAKKVAKDLVDLGKDAFLVQKAPDVARDLFVQAVATDPSNIEANWFAGWTHLQTINRGRSAAYFEKVYELNPRYRFDLLYRIGEGYQLSVDFEKALDYFNQYKQKLIDDKNYRGQDKIELSQVNRRIEECENGLILVANPAHYSIQNMGSSINGSEREYGPTINEDETIMVFTSRRRDGNLNENVDDDNVPFEDIFISRKDESGNWGYAENIGEVINTLYHDSNLSLSADGKQLYIYSDENNGDIYVSNLNSDGTFSTPLPVSENINSSYKESSMSVTADGQRAFFMSDRPGGFGGQDIYICEKDSEGQWSKSKNLGEKINTEYDEDGPFIDFDGQTLYFSSQGRGGMGGYDIFRSDYDETTEEWSEPINLGYPINTPDNDVFFVVSKDRKRGYYASVREDGLGYTDIYKVELDDVNGDWGVDLVAKSAEIEKTPEETDKPVEEPKQVEVKEMPELVPVKFLVRVQADDSKEFVNARVSFKQQGTNRVFSPVNEKPGYYSFEVESDEPTKFQLSVEKPGYVFQNLTIDLPGMDVKEQQVRRTVSLRKASSGVTKVLKNIYFNFNSASFKDSSYEELNKLENFLSQNPGVSAEIAGHTDNIGSKAYNKDLSLRRAQAVVNYLTEKGVPLTRLTAVGYGEERPLASNDDELDGRQLNRRVEFKIQ
ncbi:MAG: OmpA family protein [Bacteroidota bacterium]